MDHRTANTAGTDADEQVTAGGGDGPEDGTGLPASIAAAWGRRERPSRGPRPTLALDRIVAAAISVAEADGPAAVSMGRVAKQLGVATMSLYRYVAAKDELLALMVDAAYGPPPADPDAEEDWRAGLHRWAWAERAALYRCPWITRLPIKGPPITPNQLGWLEIGLRCLRRTGLAEAEKMSVILLVTSFVRAEATVASDIAEAARAAGSTLDETMPAYARTLASLIDADRFPALSQVLAAGVLDQPDDPDSEFVFGLDRILDGVEALVRSRRLAAGKRTDRAS